MKFLTLILGFVWAVGPQDHEPTLLKNAPDGWRFERLEFPLQFAPDLKLEGYEELQFAPGMFDPKSDSYFSYVLAMQINNRSSVDKDFVRDLFQEYFVGLCKSVGESRNLTLDVDKIKTQVAKKLGNYLVEVTMYDAFVTGEPLLLKLEVSAHQSKQDGIVLLGLASPAKSGADIWKALRGFRKGWAQVNDDLHCSLNHIFIVPDQETYDAIASAEFLQNEFAVFEKRTTVRRDMSYSGVYFYGHNTYFEFLPPGVAGMPQGASGIALGVESPGDIKRLASSLDSKEIRSFPGSITRELDGKEIPWFESLGIQQASENSRVSMFAMEYRPEFLKLWHANLPPANGGIGRAAVLERYSNYVAGSDREARLFADIAELHIVLDDRERNHFEKALSAIGYRLDKSDQKSVATGPGLKIIIEGSERPGGISGFRFELSRSTDLASPIKFGNSEMSFAGSSGIWKFAIPEK